MTFRSYYPSPDILSDVMIVAKILTTASKLYNLFNNTTPDNPEIKDTLLTMHFYVDILTLRYNITPPPNTRHDEYNKHFPIINILTPLDIAALTLHKALRLHSIYHATHIIHDDTLADIKGYLNLFPTTNTQSTTTTHTKYKTRPSSDR